MEVHHLKQETDFAALVRGPVKFGHEALIIFMHKLSGHANFQNPAAIYFV